MELQQPHPKTAATSAVFEIQSLICSIFSYLDFESWLQCSQVNVQWLDDSNDATSLSHIETKDLCHANHGCCKYNINKFKNVQSLKITHWHYQLDQYFQNLEKFLNISKLEFEANYNPQTLDIATKIVENNKNKLKKLIIRNQLMLIHLRCQFLESLFLPRLTELDVSGVNVQGFYLNKQKQKRKAILLNSNNLQNVKLDNCGLGVGFWRDMADNEVSLSNIKIFSLTGCQIDVDGNDEQLIELSYIPNIARKLNNLTHFKCTSGCGTIVPSFLFHLSHNERARESLESLDICLTSKWFLKNETIKNVITSDIDILNFSKLEDASIAFEEWQSEQSLKYGYSGQVQLVGKALGIFCTKEEQNTVFNFDNAKNMLSVFIFDTKYKI